MEEYKQANNKMFDEIVRIMSECFNDPKWLVKFFLDKKLSLKNCYVCTLDYKIISLLHIIPLKVRLNSCSFNGSYIYGACTLPEYRNKGYMTKLLNYTHEVCSKNNYECSFLVPASNKLERFYGRLGYINFFKLKRVELTKDEILKLCESLYLEASDKMDLNYSLVSKQRKDIYNNENVVIYNENDLGFADELYKLNYGGLLSTNFGYGFCTPLSPSRLKIIDFTAKKGKSGNLLKKIVETFPNYISYLIETSPFNKFFDNFGQNYFHGMVLPLNNYCEAAIKSLQMQKINPYLGISFE